MIDKIMALLPKQQDTQIQRLRNNIEGSNQVDRELEEKLLRLKYCVYVGIFEMGKTMLYCGSV